MLLIIRHQMLHDQFVKEEREQCCADSADDIFQQTQKCSAFHTKEGHTERQRSGADNDRPYPVTREERQDDAHKQAEHRHGVFVGRYKQADNKEYGTADADAFDTLPDPSFAIAGIGIDRQNGGDGEAHPSKARYFKSQTDSQSDGKAERQPDMPKILEIPKTEMPDIGPEPNIGILFAMLMHHDERKNDIAEQQTKEQIGHMLDRDRITVKERITKAHHGTEAHFWPLAENGKYDKERDEMDKDQRPLRNI